MSNSWKDNNSLRESYFDVDDSGRDEFDRAGDHYQAIIKHCLHAEFGEQANNYDEIIDMLVNQIVDEVREDYYDDNNDPEYWVRQYLSSISMVIEDAIKK